MILSQTAEYALRATAALASTGDRLVPTAELAKLADVPMPYLAKVLQQLAGADLIRGRRGVGGGYALNRAHEDISLFDVISAVSAVRMPGPMPAESEAGDVLDSLDRVVRKATHNAINVYQTVTVADIARGTVQQNGAASNGNGHANGHSNGHAKSALNGNGNGNGHGQHADSANGQTGHDHQTNGHKPSSLAVNGNGQLH
ncbi:MAG: Rrf2 family transcriptional regulator [Planctomycetota bacterium]